MTRPLPLPAIGGDRCSRSAASPFHASGDGITTTVLYFFVPYVYEYIIASTTIDILSSYSMYCGGALFFLYYYNNTTTYIFSSSYHH